MGIYEVQVTGRDTSVCEFLSIDQQDSPDTLLLRTQGETTISNTDLGACFRNEGIWTLWDKRHHFAGHTELFGVSFGV